VADIVAAGNRSDRLTSLYATIMAARRRHPPVVRLASILEIKQRQTRAPGLHLGAAADGDILANSRRTGHRKGVELGCDQLGGRKNVAHDAAGEPARQARPDALFHIRTASLPEFPVYRGLQGPLLRSRFRQYSRLWRQRFSSSFGVFQDCNLDQSGYRSPFIVSELLRQLQNLFVKARRERPLNHERALHLQSFYTCV
jgi:hypothetical protein